MHACMYVLVKEREDLKKVLDKNIYKEFGVCSSATFCSRAFQRTSDWILNEGKSIGVTCTTSVDEKKALVCIVWCSILVGCIM